MIGRDPYKIWFEVIRRFDPINEGHERVARCSFLDQAVQERDIFAYGSPEPDQFVIYKTEVDAYGVVLGRERVDA